MQRVFSLHDACEVRDLVRGAGLTDVEASSSTKTLALPPARDFLWQYVLSTPLAGPVASLDEDRRGSLERDVIDGWRSFEAGGGLHLDLGVTTATARRG